MSENITRAVCRHLQIPDHIVKAALKDFRRPKGRLNFFELGAIKVVDDSYNANPLSMKLGLDTLAEAAAQTKRRLAVLGFMAELGDEAPAYHSEVGAYARSRADVVVGVGELAKHYDPDYWFACSEACSREIERIVCSGDCLLVKGSASARMYVVVDKLKEIAKQWIGQISAG